MTFVSTGCRRRPLLEQSDSDDALQTSLKQSASDVIDQHHRMVSSDRCVEVHKIDGLCLTVCVDRIQFDCSSDHRLEDQLDQDDRPQDHHQDDERRVLCYRP